MTQIQPVAVPSRPSVQPVLGLIVGGAIAAVVIVTVIAPKLAWPALLIAGLYCLGLTLGSTFFIALQGVCHAKWSRSFEAVPREIARLLPWTLLILVPVLTLGMPTLYEWMHPDHGGHDAHHAANAFKETWLSPGFFWARSAVYLTAWVLFARILSRRPKSGSLAGKPPVARSAAFIVVFAVTFVPASFDWIMSIDFHWFSTIFGVYNFAGAFLSALAFITLAVILLPRFGVMSARADADQLHDLGRLLFTFSSFWAYIWFCQYMLIWYSNLPEETGYYLLRHSGIWATVSFLNVVFNWAVPFVLLISRSAKRDPSTLVAVCIVLLIGRALDLAFMILPPLESSSLGMPFAFLITAGSLLLFVVLLSRCVPRQFERIPGPTCLR
jgi:hypothetical protein